MKKVFLACCLVMLMPLLSHAKTSSLEPSKDKTKLLQSLVSEYYTKKELFKVKNLQNLVRSPNPHCDPLPSKSSCVSAACDRLPSYECDSKSDLEEIARYCANVDGQCVQSACSRLPSYECDSKSDIQEIAKSCSGVGDGRCIDAVCGKLPSYECDSKSDLSEIAGFCKGWFDADCITDVCSRLPSYECDSKSDMKQIVETCKSL